MKIVKIMVLVWVLTGANLLVSARPAGDITVSVNTVSGAYSVASARLNWTLSGSVGQPLHHLKRSNGTDEIGNWHSITFSWKNQIEYTGSIRWYASKPAVLFEWSLPTGAQGISPVTFPDFSNYPDSLFPFSYHNRIFPLAQYILEETSTPWMLFDEKMNACVISPASDFMVSLMTRSGGKSIGSGLNPEVKNLPAHFKHATIMVMSQGIRNAWDEWGITLRAMYHRKRPASDADVLLKYFGYWTDNGGDYYYQYDSTKGYAGTLLALRDHYRTEGIPLGYMQLDSWWYQKSRYNVYGKLGAFQKKMEYPAGPWNRSGGFMRYEADTFLFPKGLAHFQKELGLPLVTHNRYMDSSSPYHEKYAISGLGATDPGFWKEIMGYLKAAGVAVYEQDWMNYIYTLNPHMVADIDTANAFTDGMAEAARENGIDLQYCMSLPRYFMQGLKYDNLTTIRTAGDRLKPERWLNFIFTSQLAYEMGIWPWSDVFKSEETGNMIVSVLSAGPVGTGDAIGRENKANIMKACLSNGELVKPDIPLLPMDQDYVNLAKGSHLPLLAYTYTRHGNITTDYVFAFADDSTTSDEFSFKPAAIGMKNKVVVYSPLLHTVREMQAGQIFQAHLPKEKYALYLLAPVTPSGIAFLGDTGKIAATGKKRIQAITSSGSKLTVKVLFSKGESSVCLRGYCTQPVVADKGKLIQDPSTHLFTLVVPAPASGEAVSVSLTPR